MMKKKKKSNLNRAAIIIINLEEERESRLRRRYARGCASWSAVRAEAPLAGNASSDQGVAKAALGYHRRGRKKIVDRDSGNLINPFMRVTN